MNINDLMDLHPRTGRKFDTARGGSGYHGIEDSAKKEGGIGARTGRHERACATGARRRLWRCILTHPPVFRIRTVFRYVTLLAVLPVFSVPVSGQRDTLVLNDQGYFEMPGLNVMVFHDTYPEGHQGGVTVIQNGVRVASNGDLRLEPAPGQWQPVPQVGQRDIDAAGACVRVSCRYPDPDRNGKGFNPVVYPDLHIRYRVSVRAEGTSFRITVDLDRPLPEKWTGRVGFNLELFPGILFGKTWAMDDRTGLFPRQLNGPVTRDEAGDVQIRPLAEGKRLVIAPESDSQRMTIACSGGILQLLDGRVHHNNGWFIVRTPVPAGASGNAVEWMVSPHAVPGWTYAPVVHVSQTGYHPGQKKIAVIECDPGHITPEMAILQRIMPDGEHRTVLSALPDAWGKFLRYQYFIFDFSRIRDAGMYRISYGGRHTEPFKIDRDIFDRHVWQPVLETFLPVQMCHMRVNDRYRVWHGLCHMDDARMAPAGTLHFDGYRQGASTLTGFGSLEHVPGLNIGGWHDAGDYDLRVESQAETVRMLSLIAEIFGIQHDETSIDQTKRIVELHRPDGRSDIAQQIEHGALSMIAGYRALGRLYRGIIASRLRQYVLLGDGAAMTDNTVPDRNMPENPETADDRWVFTEENPRRELLVSGCLAAAYRGLKGTNDTLSQQCLETAGALWEKNSNARDFPEDRIVALCELILATDHESYKNQLRDMLPDIARHIQQTAWALGRIQTRMDDDFNRRVKAALPPVKRALDQASGENPFGVPYHPRIWGAGWEIQRFGVQLYFLHTAWPDIFSEEMMLSALNFILGCHPGPNTASFVSGVGSRSVTVAYGVNRADWSFIPGGVVSGTGLIRPDFPELSEWPYFWQQTEYVVGGGATRFMFLVLAARQCLENRE